MNIFGFRITKDKEIIEATQTVEELRKVMAILKIDNAAIEGVYELCKDPCLSGRECRHLNIERSSYVSAILSLYKGCINHEISSTL